MSSCLDDRVLFSERRCMPMACLSLSDGRGAPWTLLPSPTFLRFQEAATHTPLVASLWILFGSSSCEVESLEPSAFIAVAGPSFVRVIAAVV